MTLASLTPYLSALVMLLGILVGTLISPRISHQIGTEYSRKDLIFKKKLEYFEKILEIMEKNTRLYNQSIKKAECSKKDSEIKIIVEELKHERKNFLVMSSPLYFNIEVISDKIIRFTRVEKEIFNRFSLLNNSKNKSVSLEELRKILEILKKRGNDILLEMRKELRR